MTNNEQITLLRDALSDAISLIKALDCKDLSCDPANDISELYAALAATAAPEQPTLSECRHCGFFVDAKHGPASTKWHPLAAPVVPPAASAEQPKPVAWMTEDGRVSTDDTKQTCMPSAVKSSFTIPLYLAAPNAQQDKDAWISVDTELPPKPIRKSFYWVCGVEGAWNGVMLARWTGECFKAADEDNKVKPTHWMQVPPVPAIAAVPKEST